MIDPEEQDEFNLRLGQWIRDCRCKFQGTCLACNQFEEEQIMKGRFFEGQEVRAIFFPAGEDGWESYTVGKADVEKITVVMEPGQMTFVPWFAVWENGCIGSKHNAALVESVLYKK